jgi:hypothetical protein
MATVTEAVPRAKHSSVENTELFYPWLFSLPSFIKKKKSQAELTLSFEAGLKFCGNI